MVQGFLWADVCFFGFAFVLFLRIVKERAETERAFVAKYGL